MKSKESIVPRVALVGYGYWGPNLLRNLVSHGGFEVVGVAEAAESARQRCVRTYPHIPVFGTVSELLNQASPEAVVIATPPSTHREVALQCIRTKADILVEKPLALSVAECDEILFAAKQVGANVMVDHTFVYHPAVQYLSGQISSGTFGQLLYYDSVRINLGGFQPSTNVLWDLAPHDLSILDLFLKVRTPKSISVLGATHYDRTNANICHCHLKYDNDFIAHLHLNWVAPIKVRTVMVGGTKRMGIYDENLPSEKIKIYDKGIVVNPGRDGHDLRASYRSGDMIAPAIDSNEALGTMLAAFHRHITRDEKPPSDGDAGRRIVRILEAANASMARQGEPVELDEVANSRRTRRTAAAA